MALRRQVSRRDVDGNGYPADLAPMIQRRSQQDRPSGKLLYRRAQREPDPAIGQIDVTTSRNAAPGLPAAGRNRARWTAGGRERCLSCRCSGCIAARPSRHAIGRAVRRARIGGSGLRRRARAGSSRTRCGGGHGRNHGRRESDRAAWSGPLVRDSASRTRRRAR